MYRSLIVLGLAGCVAFDGSSPDRTPDATPVRDATTPDGPETLAQAAERVTARFQRCMTLSDFVEAGMPIWAELPIVAGENCASCHGGGEFGFIASGEAPTFFTALQTMRFLLLQYVTVDLTSGTALASMVVNTTHLTSVANGGVGTTHPVFVPQQGLEATERFRALTDRAGNCP